MKSQPALLVTLIITTVLAQRSPVPITASFPAAGLSNPHWSLQNLSVQLPFDTPSVLPPEIYPHDASIEFAVFQSKQETDEDHPTTPEGTTVSCKGSWKPGSRPSNDWLCDDGRTYWRLGVLDNWLEKDFWIDVWQPSYVSPPATPQARQIQLTHAPIHLTATTLLCTTIRLANTIYHCSLAYQPFTRAPRTEALVPDHGLAIAIERLHVAPTNTPVKVVESGGNSVRFHVREANSSSSVAAGSTLCEATLDKREPWPRADSARPCADPRFAWFLAVAPRKTTGSPEPGRLPEEAVGAALRVRRRVVRMVDVGTVGRPEWRVEIDLVYEIPLRNGSRFEWSCRDAKCEGRSRGEEVVFVDWRRSTVFLS